LRIAFLNPSGQLGGAERSLLDILASLRNAAPDWTLGLLASGDGPLLAEAESLGVETQVAPFPPALARLGDAALNRARHRWLRRGMLLKNLSLAGPQVLFYRRRLRAVLEAFRPDIVHSNGFKMHVLGAQACPSGVPLVWHIRDYVGRRQVMARLLRWHMGRCAAIVTNSRSAAEDVRRVCGPEANIFPVYNAIDLQRFAPEGEQLDLDALAGLAPCGPETARVGLLGTLARWKGHETFLRALALLPPDLPARGYVVGGALYQTEGSQLNLEDLRSLAEELELNGRVGFTGFVRDPAAAMRALDIVVHASVEPEPFGRVIVEGMACGRAVIASRAGGAVEIINEGADALGHTPGDPRMLADCIAKLARDKGLRARLGRAGRATAEQRFDRQRLADELLPIYERLAQQNMRLKKKNQPRNDTN
jgi:glycosyltransferase involved in cell wall biosynthesis